MDSDAETKLAEVVLRQGELRLAAQLTIGLAADQRATSFAGIFFTIATAAAVGFFTLFSQAKPSWPLLAAAFAGAVCAGWAAYQCISVARPALFRVAGNLPNSWWDDGVEKKPLAQCLRKESANYQRRLEENSQRLSESANRLRVALRVGLSTPGAAFVAWLAVKFFGF